MPPPRDRYRNRPRRDSGRNPQGELTVLARLGAMLLIASIILPVLAFAGILIMRHYFLVHYDRNSMLMWLLLDAAILAAGLIITENAAVKPKRNIRRR